MGGEVELREGDGMAGRGKGGDSTEGCRSSDRNV